MYLYSARDKLVTFVFGSIKNPTVKECDATMLIRAMLPGAKRVQLTYLPLVYYSKVLMTTRVMNTAIEKVTLVIEQSGTKEVCATMLNSILNAAKLNCTC